jgi:hypothetical protein
MIKGSASTREQLADAWHTARGLLLGLLLATTGAMGQSPEYHGLTGSLMFGAAHWSLDDGSSPTRFAGGLGAGYRFKLFAVNGAVVSLTPRFSLLLTRFTGIKLGSTQTGFARLDKPSVQLAVRVKSVRPYLLAEKGSASIERYVGSDLVNFYGSVPSYGFGIELPRNNPCGAGFDIAARWMSGTLSSTEWRGTGPEPRGGSISGATFTVGWSGAFRGARLLFVCR